MLTTEELRKSSPKTLQEELAKTRRENIQLHMQVKTGQSKDIHKLREIKKYIARLQTIRPERIEG